MSAFMYGGLPPDKYFEPAGILPNYTITVADPMTEQRVRAIVKDELRQELKDLYIKVKAFGDLLRSFQRPGWARGQRYRK